MIKDFKFIFDMTENAESISFEEMDDPEALFYEYGMNPDAVQHAIMDLSEGLWDKLEINSPTPSSFDIDVPDCDF